MPYPLSKGWSKTHALALMLSAPDRAPEDRLADVVATGWNLLATRWKLRCRPAVLVTVTGLDGSGKSSAIRAAREAMALCEIPVRVVWSRGGFTVPMEAAKRAARSATRLVGGGLPGPAATEEKRRWLAGRAAGVLFAGLVAAEQAIHYLLRVRLPRWRGTSVVCDRFVWDTMADLEVKLGADRWSARAAAVLLLTAAPRPDLSLLLRVAPAEAERRKPGDMPPGVLARQAAALDRMAAAGDLRIVDAGRPEEEVLDDVLDLILRTAFARFAGARSHTP